MAMSICKSCARPCLGVGTEDHTWGVPSFLWDENIQSHAKLVEEGVGCESYLPYSPLDPRTPLPPSYEGLLALNRAIDSLYFFGED